jgi:hypothetical protein
MVSAALEALVGEAPGPDALAAAVSTVPAGELAGALRLLARNHGPGAVPLLRWCLGARPDWAMAAAAALATIPSPEAAAALADAEAAGPPKPVRRELRRALYRLRQAGVSPPAAPRPPPPAAAGPEPRQAWVSAVDGTGSRGAWVVLEAPHGERILLSGIVNDAAGLLDFAGGPIAKKRLDARLRSLREESPLPWVEAPPAWVLHLLAEASARGGGRGEVARWRPLLRAAAGAAEPPVYRRLAAAEVAADPAALERSADVLALPELAGWFLDPPSVQAEALELLQAQESRLVVSDQVKEERRTALVDRVIEGHLGPEARRLWRGRLEEQAWVLLETGRPAEARRALAAALALGDPATPAGRIPFVRALAERSLHVAGEVALGRLPADEVRRIPRPLPARP